MAKQRAHVYSRYTAEALALLGGLIRAVRIESGMTAEGLATRAGISRGLLRRIENGDPGCAIGSVFEVAAIVGIPLFGMSSIDALRRESRRVEEKLVLLPAAVHAAVEEVKDDF